MIKERQRRGFPVQNEGIPLDEQETKPLPYPKNGHPFCGRFPECYNCQYFDDCEYKY